MSQLTEMVVTTIGGLIMAGGGGAAIAFALFNFVAFRARPDSVCVRDGLAG